MSDEKRMNSMLGRLFDKNKGKSPEKPPQETQPKPADPSKDDELYMDQSLFDELLADVLEDEPEETAAEIQPEEVPFVAADGIIAAAEEPVTGQAAAEETFPDFEEQVVVSDVSLYDETSAKEEPAAETPADIPEFTEPFDSATEEPEAPSADVFNGFFGEPASEQSEADTVSYGLYAESGDDGNAASESVFAVSAYTEEEQAEENAADVSEIEPEDAILMSALGYSDSAPAEVRAPVRRGTVRTGKKYSDLDGALAYNGREYTSHRQDSAITSAYEREKTALLIKSAGLALIAVFSFIFDVFGKKFGGAFSAQNYPVVNIMISLQLLLISAAISYRSIIKGLFSIVKGRPSPESVTATVVLLTVVYDILIAAAVPDSFTLYNFPAVLCLVLNAAADWLTLLRETETFARLSSFESVCTVEKLGDDSNGSAYGMRRAPFSRDYFRRVNICGFPTFYIYVILFVVALAIVLFIISLAAKRTFVNSLNVFITVVQFSLPSFALIAYTLPFFMMTRHSIDENVVILHDSDTADYGKVGTVVLEESDVFGANSIQICGITSCNPGVDYFDTVAAATAILNEVGGTISFAFRSVAGSGSEIEAENVHVAENGAEGDVGGVHYVIGTGNYLEKKWIRFPDDGNRQFLSSGKGGVVLYIAADGETILKINLRYSLDDMFSGLVGSIAEKSIRVVLSARDPFISSAMISDLLGRKDIRVNVIMTNEETDSSSGEVLDAGLIADGNEWMSAVRAAEACVKYVKWTSLRFYIAAATLGLGILLSSFLGALGAVIGMSSLFIVLFQIFSVIPSVIMSRLIFD